MIHPSSLERGISPPPMRKATRKTTLPKPPEMYQGQQSDDDQTIAAGLVGSTTAPSLAAVEAGAAQIRDHLSYFAHHLSALRRPFISTPMLDMSAFTDLYKRNQHPHGRHFVIHQHDHPISGTLWPTS